MKCVRKGCRRRGKEWFTGGPVLCQAHAIEDYGWADL